MSGQFSNQKCSKCYSKYVNLRADGFESYCGDHEHFFKKNGQLYCVNCLIKERSVKCGKCHKLIRSYDELGLWRRTVGLWDDHTADADQFGNGCCWCRKCSNSEKERNKPKQPSYSGWGPGNPEWEKQKWCRISGCPYKVSSYPELGKFGTCSLHLKQCQGTVWRELFGNMGQCESKIPIDRGDFCERCKSQTETFQQHKQRKETKNNWIFENFKRAHEKAQNYWDSLSNSERESECKRLVENMKLGKYWGINKGKEGHGAGWACDGSFWIVKNGKYTSSSPYLVPVELAEEFMKKEFGENSSALVLRDQKIVVKNKENDKDNPNSPIPSGRNDKSETIQVNLPSNSPQPNHGHNELSEVKNNNDKTLIIDLKNTKKITLTPEGNLVIEFDDKQRNNYTYPAQIITPDLINSSQELQKIRNYCQDNQKNSLSYQELKNIFGTSTENPSNDDNKAIWISCGIGGFLILGIGIILVWSKKKKTTLVNKE